MARTHNTFVEGIMAGVLSATVIAVWFLIVDIINGHILFTPAVLGRGLLGILGLRPGDTTANYVWVYTIFHYVAFSVIGIIVAAIVHAARKTPAVLAGFLITFVAFEIGFHGFVGMLSVHTALEGLAWVQIMLANLIATAVMFGFMWIRHPGLGREFDQALSGTDV